jgi:hypothetical protein
MGLDGGYTQRYFFASKSIATQEMRDDRKRNRQGITEFPGDRKPL